MINVQKFDSNAADDSQHKLYSINSKESGDRLTHEEWNNLSKAAADAQTKINDVIEAAGSGSGNGSDPHVYMSNKWTDDQTKGNFNIETTAEDQLTVNNKTKGGKINIESVSDIQIKPADDLAIYAHHRAEGNKNQVLMKIMTETNDETEIPANFKLNTGDITVTNKDNIVAIMVEVKSSYKKTPDYIISTDLAANTFTSGNIYKSTEINTKLGGITGATLSDGTTSTTSSAIISDILDTGIGKTRVIKYTDGTTNTFYKFTKVSNADGVTNILFEDSDGYGYLKVRAQAIDLRCEDHGGIALQPKGEDGSGHQNKIKFEHGGGDGLEFATFNTEKTSIFTDEYRFNKDGVWKMATRTKVASDKADINDPTTAYKYQKAADDFYDNISESDTQCSTKNIIDAGDFANKFIGDLGLCEYNYGLSIMSLDNNYNIIGALSVKSELGADPVALDGDVSDEYDVDYYANLFNIANTAIYDGTTKTYSNTSIKKMLLSTIVSEEKQSWNVIALVDENNEYTGRVIQLIETSVKDTVNISDLIALIDYFKTGAGQANGPWAQL